MSEEFTHVGGEKLCFRRVCSVGNWRQLFTAVDPLSPVAVGEIDDSDWMRFSEVVIPKWLILGVIISRPLTLNDITSPIWSRLDYARTTCCHILLCHAMLSCGALETFIRPIRLSVHSPSKFTKQYVLRSMMFFLSSE